MTFGIGFASPHYAGIVTDRLLSGASSVDDSDKCGAVRYVDGRFAYTFAGLAEVVRYEFQTRQSLARALGEAGRPDQPGGPPAGIATALQRVARYMTDATSTMRIRPEDKRMSILLAGFRREDDDSLVAEMHLISNFEELTGTPAAAARSEFTVSSQRVAGARLWWIGCADLKQDARTSVLDLLQASPVVPPAEVVKALVGEIRKASDQDEARIGKRCSSIVVHGESGQAEVDYHPDQAVDRVHATATIVAEYGNVGAYYTIDQSLTDARLRGNPVATGVPAVHKRQPCPCGSGRQYKNCHGNPRAVHQVDSYTLTGRTCTLAMPEDGSPLVNFSNESLMGQRGRGRTAE